MWGFTRTRGQPSLVTLGNRARDKGDWDVAVALYSGALARDLRNAPLWVQYGHALKESGKLQDPAKLAQAEAAYRRALIYAPRVAETHLQLGHVLKLRGRIDEAKAAYLRALALDPAFAAARDELRALGWEEGDGTELQAALASLDGVAVPRRRRSSLIEQADAARDATQWALAARCYRAVSDRDPGNAEIWVQYGHALKEAGNLKDPARLAAAEAAYRRALTLKPGIADTHLQFGHVLKLQGRAEEAEAAYMRAFALDPSMPLPLQELSGLGWSEAQTSELRGLVGSNLPLASSSTSAATFRNDARRGLKRLRLGLRCPKPSVIINLADRARNAGQWERAARLYRKALDRNPRNAAIWIQYGHALKESGELRDPDMLAQAETAYRTALSLDPSVADTYLQLGHALKLQGKTEEAQAAYLRAFTLDPSVPYPLQELSGLGWSEVHSSELRGMLRSGASDPISTPEDITLEKHPIAAASTTVLGGDSTIIRDLLDGSAAVVRKQDVEAADSADDPESYANWVRLYDTIDDDDREVIAKAIDEMVDRPLISVIMPVYNTPEPYLRAAIDSVRQQLYPNWELCIADDASTASHVRAVLEHYSTIDPRIKVCYRAENGHISAASNSALSLAEGSFVALLDHDDELREHALYMVAALLDADPQIDLIYSDEDRIDTQGRRSNPYFKSDWNPDLMLSQNMFSHLGVYRRSLIDRVGGFRSAYDGSQDYDLVLRAQGATSPDRIRHIPHILYHWRAIPGSVALDGEDAKPYALIRARAAIADFLAQSGITAEVLPSPHSAFNRVRYAIPEPVPRVTIIIPTRDRVDLLRRCVEGLLHRTDYSDFEILIVDNQSLEPASRLYFESLSGDSRIRILPYNGSFNLSSINNFAAAHATGSLICFLGNDTESINRDWLTEMVSHALRSEIGGVGALLYFPDGRIKHAGFALDFGDVAHNVHQGLHLGDRGDYGYFGRAALVQNLSAVSAVCLLMSKVVFEKIGGFNEKDLPRTYGDIDLCLRIREAGYRIVWTPHAEFYHHAPALQSLDTGGDQLVDAEIGYMSRRWGHVLDHDPCHNPNLGSDRLSFGLAVPPRIEWPWRHADAGQHVPLTSSSEARLVAASGLFNPAWYSAQNPDVAAAGIDPLEHYLGNGSGEGRCPNPVFDPTWYREQYPDVAAEGIEPLVHYLRTGSAEGRRPSPLFDPVLYREQHPDVATGMEPLAHYLLTTTTAGRRFVAPGRLSNHPDMQIPDFFELRGLTPRGPIAVVVHLYYPELWEEMRIAIERISHPFDLFVSLVKDASDHMRRVIKQAFPYAHIFDFRDERGRDIARFLALLQTGVLFRYELVCKLHSKRSPFETDGDGWRRALIDGILGSSHQVDQIVSAFRSDPDLGMVVADGNIYSGYEHWSGTERLLAELLPRMGIAPVVKGRSFPGGSIFWIRPLLLRTLAAAGINLGDFEPEPLPRDGALAHAVERMFGLICEDAGMRVAEWGRLTKAPPVGGRSSKVHVIAYFLPQFHPIRENDEWWGAGFTEWTNVTRSRPLFAGHRQPLLPSELGFYDLRLSETREAQAALAREYGLAGFCYYYYWFNGHRLLERPLDEVLASGKPDFPFLICWGNEPWTRNWDGLNDKVLLPQTYEPGWVTLFARDVAPLLRDRRYFRLDGRPMLLIYRIGHVPEAAATMQALRAALAYEGIPEVHLAAAWVSFPNDVELPADPAVLGLDAYYEHPPHRLPARLLRPRPADLPEESLHGLYDYNRSAAAALAKLDEPIIGRRHRGVMAGFDNTARRGADATVFHGATPTNFRRWLRSTILHERRQKGERIVFVNAWNEWAEGTCLEPDRDFGRGWLEAVASAAELEWSKTEEIGAHTGSSGSESQRLVAALPMR